MNMKATRMLQTVSLFFDSHFSGKGSFIESRRDIDSRKCIPSKGTGSEGIMSFLFSTELSLVLWNTIL